MFIFNKIFNIKPFKFEGTKTLIDLLILFEETKNLSTISSADILFFLNSNSFTKTEK